MKHQIEALLTDTIGRVPCRFLPRRLADWLCDVAVAVEGRRADAERNTL